MFRIRAPGCSLMASPTKSKRVSQILILPDDNQSIIGIML